MKQPVLHSAGFTLVEVLVALAIVATALVIGLTSTGMLSNDVQRQSRAFFAQLCAENQLVQQRLSGSFPDVGTTQTACKQGGRELVVNTRVSTTPNPNFRRIDVNVSDDQGFILHIASVLGQLR